jgi:predicted transcriptional regulator
MDDRTPRLRDLGQLETRIMEILWQRTGALSVREVCRCLERDHDSAYTTVMTTLDRLFKKGVLSREKHGLAYAYAPVLERDAFHRRQVESAVAGLMARSASAEPVLSGFLDAAAGLDEDNLRRLEEMIRERRRHGR